MMDMASSSLEAFASPPPVVRLVNAFAEPFNNAVATARTCYAPRVISAEDVDRDDKSRAQRDAIARSTYDAGHHTTLQHATFQFVLQNVSRQFIWSFLHAHPFYNSEQVSQRYVSVKPDTVLIPNLPGPAQRLFRDTVDQQMKCYQALAQMLTPAAAQAYFGIFPARLKHADKYASAVRKKAQEVARYALPIGTFAYLYHTISGITLHRYHRLCNMLDVPAETRLVVRAMVDAVNAHDPLFFRDIEDPLPLAETHEFAALQGLGRVDISSDARDFRNGFDADLGLRTSRLVSHQPDAEALLGAAARMVLGVGPKTLDDGAALARVLSPAQNPYLAGALNLTTMGKLTRTLAHVHYTFQKKLSHTADSQDQRHRMAVGSRPVLHTHYVSGSPDVVVPQLLAEVPEAMDTFMTTMQQTWQAIDQLLDQDIAPQDALYLLPNAFSIRFMESGDLLALHHKWTTRLCYNAQEEIWRASLDEVRAVSEVHPRIGAYLLPPCGLRRDAGVRPICPEGSRYCGVPVWKKPLASYTRVI